MKISPAAEFAIRGSLVLAARFGQGPVTLDAICAARGLSKQYLTKIFASLAKAQIITPVRGKHGGFVLSRPPSDITLLQVVEAVEGPIALNFCMQNPPQCEAILGCNVHPVWSEIQAMIREKLAHVTLDTCIRDDCKVSV